MGKIVYNGREYLSAGTASTMQGATSTTDGVSGLVPQPLIADREKVLKGDGTWGYASEVEANPSGTATDTLNTIDIDGTIYEIQGGGGSSGGMSAYTEVVLWSDNNGSISPSSVTLIDSLSNYDAIYIVQAASNTLTLMSSQIIPVSAIDTSGNGYFGVYDAGGNSYYYSVLSYIDDTHLLLNSWSSNNKVTFYKVVGIKYGGNLSPIIYSTEEREIGVWIDNKPIYEKTFYKEFNGISRDTFYDVADCTSMGIENLVELSYSCRYVYPSDNIDINVAYDDNMVDAIWQRDLKKIQAKQTMTSSNLSLKYWRFWVTIRYTKTTDTAGSGSYNTLGVPNVHYSADEQVIGTWVDGSTIYEKTIKTTLVAGSVQTVQHLITNANQIVGYEGRIIDNGGICLAPHPFMGSPPAYSWILYDVGLTYFRYNASSYLSGTVYVTLRYTKTTD